MTAALIAVYLLARIISGEAGGCDVRTQIAVGHVWRNRQQAGIIGGWFGDAEPTATHRFVAEWYWLEDDPTDGATALWSTADLQLPAVKALAAGMIETYRADCGLRAFKPKERTP